jgi:hypothetical protein
VAGLGWGSRGFNYGLGGHLSFIRSILLFILFGRASFTFASMSYPSVEGFECFTAF